MLKINVYNDEKRSGSPKDTFNVMFNPESYSLKYTNVYQNFQGINTSGREAKYSLSKPENLSIKLILDDTGVAKYPDTGYWRYSPFSSTSALYGKFKETRDVYKEVQKFLELTFYMDGKIHQPKFLKLEWGDLNFDCRLESVEVHYVLFNRSGEPIRAELDTVFIGDIRDSKRVKKENKNSPDLTHYQTVKSGDTLLLISQEIYKDPKYYIELAKVNELNNFRTLKIGTTIKLPPIE